MAIVDTHDVFRNALEAVLASEADLRVTAFSEPVAADRLGSFDVVLADEPWLRAAARSALADVARRTGVVAMGMGEFDFYADAAIEAGAVGYWPKFGDIDALLALIRAAGLVTEAHRDGVALDAPMRSTLGASSRRAIRAGAAGGNPFVLH